MAHHVWWSSPPWYKANREHILYWVDENAPRNKKIGFVVESKEGRWVAWHCHDYQNSHLGTYDDLEEAKGQLNAEIVKLILKESINEPT